MKYLTTAVSAAAMTLLLGAGALVATTGAASARMVCNSDGDCWHTERNYSYPDRSYVRHNDDWYFHQTWNDERHHYREPHNGRGYYKGGLWIGF